MKLEDLTPEQIDQAKLRWKAIRISAASRSS